MMNLSAFCRRVANGDGGSCSMLLVLAAFFMGGVGMWAMHYLSDM